MITCKHIANKGVNAFDIQLTFELEQSYNPQYYIDKLNNIHQLEKLAGDYYYRLRFVGNYFQCKILLKKIALLQKRFESERKRIDKENYNKLLNLNNMLK